MSINLKGSFLVVLLIALVLTVTTDAFDGFDEAEGQQQLGADEAALEKLQELLSSNDARQNAMYYGGETAGGNPEAFAIEEDISFPGTSPAIASLGEIAGLAVCPAGKLHLFQRADVVWEADSFHANNTYKHISRGPIKNDTVIEIDPNTGARLASWGSNRFYMPHGISFDADGNIWLTDVALHQVFRFKRGSYDKPDLVVGQAFVPGTGDGQFCKPTDVAISSTGIVYISDGYCNSRIVILDQSGTLVGYIGLEDGMIIHSITLLEKDDLICVADRENRRILCFTAGLNDEAPGKLVYSVTHSELGRVFAIDHIGDDILALNGPEDGNQGTNGVTLDLIQERLVNEWAPKNGLFVDPHDISVTPDLNSFFISDMGPNAPKKVYKFNLFA